VHYHGRHRSVSDCAEGGGIVSRNGESRPQAAAEDVQLGDSQGVCEADPFKVESVTAITLDREIPRNWRFNTEEDEQKLLDAANPHLRAVIVALLDTAARPGEILHQTVA
jgi:hypothetical protein